MTKKKSQQQPKHPRPVETMDDEDDDEEISEDEAFNSDDERKYGAFFNSKHHYDDNNSESQSGSSDDDNDEDDDDDATDDEDDDNDEDGDGGQYMLDLLDRLNDDKGDKEKQSSSATKDSHSIPHLPESEYSSAVVNTQELTLDGLLGGLEDTAGFGWVQKTLKSVAKGTPTSAPAPKVVSDRAERQVHYKIQARNISKQFNEIVKTNRNAETLDFRNHSQIHVLNNEILVDKFEPTTEFEKQLAQALEQAGQIDEEAILKAEQEKLQDDLGSAKLTLEEFQKRRAQLAKMRALMFYHEQKRHHINKIKSKKYRKIRKKQRERQKEAELSAALDGENADLVRELEEKEEIERMKERASLAHKNTSKWAKRILKRGKNVDVDTRRALSAQLKKGDDLRKRIQSTMQNQDDDDSDDEENDLIESARKVLQDTEQDEDDEEAQQQSGIFKLSFMQRGLEKQRAQAREEARQLLMELEADDEEERENQNSDNDENPPQEQQDKARMKKGGNKMASKEEMKNVLNQGDLVAAALKHGTANVVTVSGNISVDIGFHDKDQIAESGNTATVSEHKTSLLTAETVKVSKDSASKPKISGQTTTRDRSATSKKQQNDASSQKKNEEGEANPWLEIATTEKPAEMTNPSSSKSLLSKAKAKSGNKNRGFVDIDRAVDLLDVNKSKPFAHEATKESNKNDPKASEKTIVMLTQEELVRKAFAAPADLDMDDDFAKEKEAIEKEEDPTRKIPKNEKDMGGVSGWGSWAGQGAPPPSRLRKLPPKLQPPEAPIPKRQRLDAKKPGVIISQKRISKAGKYLLADVPYPFTSREEYERSMVGGIGREWNVTSSLKAMTRPEVYKRAGKVIQPLSQKVSQSIKDPV